MGLEQDRYRIFFEASADAMLILDDGVFVDCNQSTLDMLGFESREALFATHPAELSPPTQPDGRNSFEKANEIIEKTFEEGSSRFDWIHLKKSGEMLTVEVLLTAIPYEEKTILHVVWRDIFKRVQLKEELIAHRNKLQAEVTKRTQELEQTLMEAQLLGEAVSQSGVSTLITDIHGKIEYINPAFTKINGYTPEEIYGKSPAILSSGLQNDDFYKKMWETIKKGKIWTGTLRNMRKNGQLYWAELKISPVCDEAGKIHHYVGIETDISDFIEAKEKAEKANQAKSNFLSSMSHELRTPLNSIIGFTQLLEVDKQGAFTENQKTQLFHIRNAGDHLLSLVDEVLDLAKVESGKLAFNIKNVDFRAILNECLDLAKASYNQLNVEVIDRTDFELPFLETDPVRAKQVILNLITNAKKYNKKDGYVYIDSAQTDQQSVRLSVTDTGSGISIEKQAELFTPFNRLGHENSHVDGTGIGLVLTKKIIEGMGGQIGVHSVLGEGSTFWVEFPAHEAIEKEETHHIKNDLCKLDCYGQSHTLLYVEDSDLNRKLMAGFVSEIPNLDLVCVANAHEAIDVVEKLNPHIILMDINLPDLNGFKAFIKLAQMEKVKDIPVVALSADAMPETKEKALKLGFSEYLSKPFKMSDLMSVLNTYIRDETST